MDKELIMTNIKSLRQKRDLTQEALADALGISRQSVIALESGRYMPSLPLACEIARFFQVSLDDIFNYEHQTLQVNEMEEKMRNRQLTSWNPFRDLQGFSEDFFNRAFFGLDRLANLAPVPSVNILQDHENVVIKMPVPGYKEEDLEIDITDEYITISAHAEQEEEEKKKGFFRQEYSCQSFSRTVPFPVPVNSDKAEAMIERGILKVVVPKNEPEKPKSKKLTIKKK